MSQIFSKCLQMSPNVARLKTRCPNFGAPDNGMSQFLAWKLDVVPILALPDNGMSQFSARKLDVVPILALPDNGMSQFDVVPILALPDNGMSQLLRGEGLNVLLLMAEPLRLGWIGTEWEGAGRSWTYLNILKHFWTCCDILRHETF